MSRADVMSAISRLFHALDDRDLAAFGDSWTEDAVLHVTLWGQPQLDLHGRQAILGVVGGGAGAEAPAAAPQRSELCHVIGSIAVVELTEDSARALAYGTYVRSGDPAQLGGVGRYEDRLVRGDDGVWRVRERFHQFLSPLGN